jgi:hypothetical protein
MVCLSIAGAFVAGAHYFAVDRPQQENALQAPNNYFCSPSTFSSCAQYGDLCYQCIGWGAAAQGCEISGSDMTAICEALYTPKYECNPQGLCIEV